MSDDRDQKIKDLEEQNIQLKQLLHDTAAAARELLDNDGAGGSYDASKAFKARQRLRELVFSENLIYECKVCGFRGKVLLDSTRGIHHRPADAHVCSGTAKGPDLSSGRPYWMDSGRHG